MLTIIAFLLTLAGSVNWLLIGLLQYDFVAGIFGYQASVFSRIIYIVIGASSVFLVFKLFKNKGTLPVFSRRNKKDLAENIQKMKTPKQPAYNNIEADRDIQDNPNPYFREDFDKEDFNPDNRYMEEDNHHKSLFDEHLDDRY